jgi:DNA-binding NarL/FixJ family response regulator
MEAHARQPGPSRSSSTPHACVTSSSRRAATLGSRVLVADDHPVLRQALRRLLERAGLEVVAEAGDGAEAVRLALAERPDIALLDLVMPRVGGLEAARKITDTCPGTRVVMISGHVGSEQVMHARRAGAVAFIAKTASHEEVLAILDAVREERPYTGSTEAGTTIDRYFESPGGPAPVVGVEGLTPREREVLRLVAGGHSSASVAAIFGVSARTVEAHREHIMRKLGIHSVASLTRFAVECGIV